MLFCFGRNDRDPPTQRAKELVIKLRCISNFELCFGLFGIFFVGNMVGILYFMKSMILYCCYHGLDPCYCVLYQCMNFVSLYFDIASLGLILQNNWPFFQGESYIDLSNLLYSLNLMFCLIVIYPVFSSYREFKYIQANIHGNERLSDGGISNSSHEIDYQMNSVINPENENENNNSNNHNDDNNGNNINRNPNSNQRAQQFFERPNIIREEYKNDYEEEEEKNNFGNNNQNINNLNEGVNGIRRNSQHGNSILNENFGNSSYQNRQNNFETNIKRENNNGEYNSNINIRSTTTNNSNTNRTFNPFIGRGVLIGSSE